MKIGFSIFYLFCITVSYAQFYNGSNIEFGKNRVQYNDFLWRSQDFRDFKIYYYAGEDDLVEYCAKAFHRDLFQLEDFFNFKLDNHLDIIVYSTKAKFNQSNIGLTQDNNAVVGGLTKVVGSKVFIYYEGDHQKLNEQIKSTLAEIMLNRMLFGGAWKDAFKANALASYPEWFINGFVSFMSKDWDANMESRVKDGFLTGRFNDFSKLEGEEAVYAGHALWHYIEESFGKNMIPKILYVARITRNIKIGFNNVLGQSVKQLSSAMSNFYKTTYYKDVKNQNEKKGEQIDFHYKKEREYYGFKVSPDEKKLAFVENELGHYRLIIEDLATHKKHVIYRAEAKLHRSIDKTFPVLCWRPSGDALTFVNERKGSLDLRIYSLNDKKMTKKALFKMEKVLSMDYSEDGKKIIFSGVNSGQTDLYLYDLAGNYASKITDDIWDDLDAKFINHSTQIIFVSNRPKDTLENNPPEIEPFERKNDVFVYDLKYLNRHIIPLTRITDTPFANERNPIETKDGSITFLSDENGLYNRYLALKDSAISFIDTTIHYRYFSNLIPQTNLVTSIEEDNYSAKKDQFFSLIYQNHRYKLFQHEISETDSTHLKDLSYKQKEKLYAKNHQSFIKEAVPETKTDSLSTNKTTIEIQNYQFENKNYDKQVIVLGENNTVQNKTKEDKKDPLYAYKKPLEKLYKVNFAKDFLATQIDNQFMNNTYQRYTGAGSVYYFPKISALTKIGFSDVFEDYKLVGGFRLPLDLKSSEFLGDVQLLKKRLDHRFIAYRQSYISQNQSDNSLYKQKIYTAKYQLSYPFSETLSLRGSINYRHDQDVYLSTDNQSLARPSVDLNQASGVVSLVFDNSYAIQANTWEGTKFKLFAEYVNDFKPNQSMINLGFDFRHSVKLVKNFIWVNRLAGATSLGQEKLVYYMGSVDNWTLRSNPSFNNSIQVDPSQNFAYQTIATPMRGYIQNARNGNSFLIWNTEFRLPIFSFLSKYPLRNEFLKTFQIIAFGDLGTAWTGSGPFSSNNYFNTQTIIDKPLTIKLQNSQNPIIFGFGGGLRSKIFNYFFRLDCGWGLNSGTVYKRPKLQLSIGYDI